MEADLRFSSYGSEQYRAPRRVGRSMAGHRRPLAQLAVFAALNDTLPGTPRIGPAIVAHLSGSRSAFGAFDGPIDTVRDWVNNHSSFVPDWMIDAVNDASSSLDAAWDRVSQLTTETSTWASKAASATAEAVNFKKMYDTIAANLGKMATIGPDLRDVLTAALSGNSSELNAIRKGSAMNRLVLNRNADDALLVVIYLLLFPFAPVWLGTQNVYRGLINAAIGLTGCHLKLAGFDPFDPLFYVDLLRATVVAGAGGDLTQALVLFWTDYIRNKTGANLSPTGAFRMAVYTISSLPIPGPMVLVSMFLSDPWVQEDLRSCGIGNNVVAGLTALLDCLQATNGEQIIQCASSALDVAAPGLGQRLRQLGLNPLDLRTLAITAFKFSGRPDLMFNEALNPGISAALVGVGVGGLARVFPLLQGVGGKYVDPDAVIGGISKALRAGGPQTSALSKTFDMGRVIYNAVAKNPADFQSAISHLTENRWNVEAAVAAIRANETAFDVRALKLNGFGAIPEIDSAVSDGNSVFQNLMRAPAGRAAIYLLAKAYPLTLGRKILSDLVPVIERDYMQEILQLGLGTVDGYLARVTASYGPKPPPGKQASSTTGVTPVAKTTTSGSARSALLDTKNKDSKRYVSGKTPTNRTNVRGQANLRRTRTRQSGGSAGGSAGGSTTTTTTTTASPPKASPPTTPPPVPKTDWASILAAAGAGLFVGGPIGAAAGAAITAALKK